MKKLLSLLLLIVLAFTACSKTNTIDTPQEIKTDESETVFSTEEEENIYSTAQLPQQQLFDEDPYETAGMPQLFDSIEEAGGGSLAWSRFMVPCSDGLSDPSIDIIPFDYIIDFADEETVDLWITEQTDNLNKRPATGLMDYPNLISFIKTFDVPVDKVAEHMKEIQLIAIEQNWSETDYFTDEEIALIVSLDEAAIMEHFVCDYTLYHDGKLFTPMWFYLHTPDDYREMGITLEMVEDKLSSFADIPISREAQAAFEEKLSDFTDEDVSFNQIRANNQ